jgi:ribosome-associated protein
MEPKEMVSQIVRILDAKKAENIKVLRVDKQTILADYFIICNGKSSTQIKALTEETDGRMSELGEPPMRREGHRSDTWVLLDFGAVVVHIFTEEARAFYDLERLWSDAEEVDVSSLLSP